jgi:pimeloyl-ACP methyl ester carboxylesterase
MTVVDASAVIEAHRRSGRRFTAAGIGSFVREEGSGEPVVCLHGVPASSFLYRKVVTELASRGLRGIAFDLPGLGLADRPVVADYTWTGLGRFASAAVDALGLERFHLVVHDIGGPVGFEVAATLPDRIASITVLNAPVLVGHFHRPWVMEPFAHRGIGEVYLRMLRPPLFRWLMGRQGVADLTKVSRAELDAYPALLKHGDGGRAFLKIMRGFELTQAKEDRYTAVLRDRRYPVQIVWGGQDPSLTLTVRGEQARRAAGLAELTVLPGKHFLQEDQAPAIADAVAALARLSGHPEDRERP